MRRLAAFALVLLFAPLAGARPKRTSAPAPLTPDQLTVAAAIVQDTFARPRPGTTALVLCLDVQVTDAAPDEGVSDEGVSGAGASDGEVPGQEFPQPRAHGRARRGAKHARPTPPPPPLAPVMRGAPQAMVDELNRPGRTVVSAAACRLEPLQPYGLKDAPHTPAQLVTVRLAPGPTPTRARIDWSSAPETAHSRDCTAAHDGHSWTVHCGGTWAQ